MSKLLLTNISGNEKWDWDDMEGLTAMLTDAEFRSPMIHQEFADRLSKIAELHRRKAGEATGESSNLPPKTAA